MQILEEKTASHFLTQNYLVFKQNQPIQRILDLLRTDPTKEILVTDQEGVFQGHICKNELLLESLFTGEVTQRALPTITKRPPFIAKSTMPLQTLIKAILQAGAKTIPVCDSQGKLLGIVDSLRILREVSHDLTQVKGLYNEVHRNLKQYREYLNIVCHDLRSPLNIAAITNDYLASLLDQEQQQRALKCTQTLKKNHAKALGLVSNLLDLGRLQAGIPLNFTLLDIEEYLAAQQTNWAILASLKQIRIHFENKKQRLGASIDKHRFQHVLDNIIGNAIKYAPSQSTITVSCTSREQSLDICIVDEGPGLDDHQISGLFQRFKQGLESNSKNTNSLGVGLGLSIAKQFAQLHQGQLTAEKGRKKWRKVHHHYS